MSKSFRHISKIALLLSVIFIATSCTSTQPDQGISQNISRPAAWASPIEKEGLGNFYKVNDDLYRGQQPTQQGIEQLQKMGIKTIVDLRAEYSDKNLLKNTSFQYQYIPMMAWAPHQEDVIKFLKIVTDKQNTPVFVHCKRGADRTGFMCAAYRIAVCGWSKQQAIDEMTKGPYKFSPLWHDLVTFLTKLDVQQIRQQAGIVNPSPSPVLSQ
jgi:protein tyrosine phosphatase (PTP) superfamily phosphohydrolase (DUF442 family)